jgi:thioredoxin-related protein
MNRLLLALLLALLWPLAGLAESEPVPVDQAGQAYPEQPQWFKDSFLDIREDVAEAAAQGKRLILYFHQNGCPYCARLLRDNFGNRAIAQKTRKHFDVVAINIWGDREVTGLDGKSTTEKQFARALKVQYTPTLLLLDERGRVVLRINGYFEPHKFSVALDYVAGHHEQSQDFRSFYASVSPVKASGRLHELADSLPHPLRLKDARRDSYRPLVVFFEQKVCAECDELHNDLLKKRAVATSLSGLDTAIVDMWSDEPIQTPDGRMMKVRDWARELKIDYAPSLVFFDSAGKEVFRVEAYLRTYHFQGALDYVVSGAYRFQPSFQRYLQHRTEVLQARGFKVDLME